MDRKTIEESKTGILEDIKGKKNILVSFGGIQQGLGIPVFEFFNSLKDIEADIVFLRDFNQAWYHLGVDDQRNSLNKVYEYLNALLSKNSYTKVVFMGNSMGGYAALLFGSLLNIHKVLAFSPQTTLRRSHRFFHLDYRWRKQLNTVYSTSKENKKYFDLAEVLRNHDSNTLNAEIYYCPTHRLDNWHARRMNTTKGVHIIPIKEGGHAIVKTMRADGSLLRIIESALSS